MASKTKKFSEIIEKRISKNRLTLPLVWLVQTKKANNQELSKSLRGKNLKIDNELHIF